MGFGGKLKGFGKTVIKTTYENSGAQKVKKDAMQTAHDTMTGMHQMDRAIFGGEGLRHNVKKVRQLLKENEKKAPPKKGTSFKK